MCSTPPKNIVSGTITVEHFNTFLSHQLTMKTNQGPKKEKEKKAYPGKQKQRQSSNIRSENICLSARTTFVMA
jgi:hypothetical protein